MAVYIALLRGINVGGKNMVKMPELKNMLETMGLGQVKTYIQSGNVVFESAQSAELLRERIEREFQSRFGFSVTIVLRTAEQWRQLIENCPFQQTALSEGQSIHISLLTEEPSPEVLRILSEANDGMDEYEVLDQQVYFLFRQSVLDSRLAKGLQKLGNTVTSRNLNTIVKLDSMAEAMKA